MVTGKPGWGEWGLLLFLEASSRGVERLCAITARRAATRPSFSGGGGGGGIEGEMACSNRVSPPARSSCVPRTHTLSKTSPIASVRASATTRSPLAASGKSAPLVLSLVFPSRNVLTEPLRRPPVRAKIGPRRNQTRERGAQVFGVAVRTRQGIAFRFGKRQHRRSNRTYSGGNQKIVNLRPFLRWPSFWREKACTRR